jgi:hypothetical protein
MTTTTLTTTTTFVSPAGFRQRRLARGWQPVQLIGHMKIAAGLDGVSLPATWLLLRALFLWENNRAPVPGYYAALLYRVFNTPAPHCLPAGTPVGR